MSNNQSQRTLPKPLERLAELAFDLRLIGSKTMSQVWRRPGRRWWSTSVEGCSDICENATRRTRRFGEPVTSWIRII